MPLCATRGRIGNRRLGDKGGLADMCAMQSPVPSQAGSRATRLEAALTAAFSPVVLRVEDDSARHAGHAGAQPTGQTHYSVLLVSAVFAGMPRVTRSRAVHEVLKREFADGMHALALTLRSPEEFSAGGAG
jgi:BolA protein